MAHVIALQETDNRPEVMTLQHHGYDVICEGDIGIALEKAKFSSIENKSFVKNGPVAAVAITKDHGTPPKTTEFVSIQISGYDLENDPAKSDPNTLQRVRASVLSARESEELTEKITKICTDAGCDTILIG